jgi:hypothetical protein
MRRSRPAAPAGPRERGLSRLRPGPGRRRRRAVPRRHRRQRQLAGRRDSSRVRRRPERMTPCSHATAICRPASSARAVRRGADPRSRWSCPGGVMSRSPASVVRLRISVRGRAVRDISRARTRGYRASDGAAGVIDHAGEEPIECVLCGAAVDSDGRAGVCDACAHAARPPPPVSRRAPSPMCDVLFRIGRDG